MLTQNDVTIIMISFYLEEVLFKTIDRLIEVTKYPYRLVVGDNFSDNSNKIRKKLKEYVDDGKIDKVYFFNKNFKAKNTKFIFNKEPKTKFTVLTDSDAYILNRSTDCWLTDFINKFESNKEIGLISFSSLNSPTQITSTGGDKHERVKKVKKLVNGDFCVKGPNNKCHHNGHYMTFKTELLKNLPNKIFTDGAIMSQLKESKNKSLRYDKNSVLNLSTIVSGFKDFNIPNVDLIENKNYLQIRNKSGDLTNSPDIKENDYIIYTKK